MIFKKKVDIEKRKKILRILYSSFYVDDYSINISKHISDVFIEESFLKYKIKLKTFRPGIIIGKAGAQINKTRKNLINELDKDVELLIEENKLWWKMY